MFEVLPALLCCYIDAARGSDRLVLQIVTKDAAGDAHHDTSKNCHLKVPRSQDTAILPGQWFG